MESTVRDVALIFEGGGMRNSYSAGAIGVMLEQGLFFDDVYGLSAGRRMRSTTSRVTRAATKPRSPHVSTTSRFAGG